MLAAILVYGLCSFACGFLLCALANMDQITDVLSLVDGGVDGVLVKLNRVDASARAACLLLCLASSPLVWLAANRARTDRCFVVLVVDEFDHGARHVERAFAQAVDRAIVVKAHDLAIELARLRPAPVCLVGLSVGAADAVLGARGKLMRCIVPTSSVLLATAGSVFIINRLHSPTKVTRHVQAIADMWGAEHE